MDTNMTGSENWTLEDGRLTVRRNAMEYTGEFAPWQPCRDDIREAVLEDGIFSIPRDAFRDCQNLRSVKFPESVREIGDGAFRSCRSLSDIIIPSGVWKIGENAFAGCGALASVTFRGAAPKIGPDAFAGVAADACVPAGDPSWDREDARDAGGSITWNRYVPDPVSPDAGEPVSPNDRGARDGKAVSGEQRGNRRQYQLEIQEIRQFLDQYNFSEAFAARIHRAYGSDSIRLIRENPYRLAEEIKGVGFRSADRLASRMGMENDRDIRLRGGLLYAMTRFSENGHCFARREQLLEEAQRLLQTDPGALGSALDRLLEASDILRDGEALYRPEIYHAELGCAESLRRLLSAGKSVRIDPDAALRAALSSGMEYVAEQQDAIREAVSSKVLVLTGGTGTGKTAVIKGILSAYETQRCRILLAAPTGRAARRLSEAAGREARAIPHMLGTTHRGDFRRNGENPLRGDVLIVDECSQLDIVLTDSLLKALPDTMTLILVGDAEQLPGAGPGNVLNDLIDSGAVPVIRLSQVHHQAQRSQIIMNAQGICHGVLPDMSNPTGTNFFFASQASDEAIAKTVVQLCVSRLPRFYGVDSFRDIQVLSPIHKGVCGTENLNRLLQDALNPSVRLLNRTGIQFRPGDKVMQNRNSFEKEVFTGDIGRVVQISPGPQRVTVDFSGRAVTYGRTDLDELTLAYAITVHKARGSKYPIVVIPLTLNHRNMLRRDLLYTAVTRARDVLVMVGSREAVSYAIRSDSPAPRNTKLAERLRV